MHSRKKINSLKAVILGLGKAVPLHSISQHEAARLAQSLCGYSHATSHLLPLLYQRTRVENRGSVLLDQDLPDAKLVTSFFQTGSDEEDLGPDTEKRMARYALEAPRLGVQASQRALMDAGVSVNAIDHLVTVSCTGFSAPGFDMSLIKELGLKHSVSRTHIGFMGCHGAFNGLRVASALARENPGSSVLLCSVELCSIHFAYSAHAEKIVSNALFADGASAAILSAHGHSPGRWRLLTTGSTIFPDSEDAMTWKIGNHGFQMHLSAKVPSLILEYLPFWLNPWLSAQGVSMSQIRSWAIHPGGPRVLDAVEKALGLTPANTKVSREILANHGNMSSATLIFILERLSQRKAPAPCVALGFGPGLAVEAALLV